MFKLLQFLSNFDWITPGIALAEDLIHDPTLFQTNSWAFFVPYDEAISRGWNAFDIASLMKQHGVKTWGRQITGGELFFSVKLEQAQWAEYVLSRAGIPLTELSQGPPRPHSHEPKENPSANEVPFRESTRDEKAEERKSKKRSGQPVRWMGIDW